MFWLVFLSATVATAFCSFVFVNRYLSFKRHKNTLPFALATLLINMWILLSITYLLPLDVFYAARASSIDLPGSGNGSEALQQPKFKKPRDLTSLQNGAETQDPMPNVAFLWYSIYWVEFVICWFVLPVLISYLDLKYLVPRFQGASQRSTILQRVRKAILTNIKFYALCAVGLAVGIFYLEFGAKRGLADLKPLIISLSHLYSLSYTLILLSMGLVLLPKAILFENDDENKLFVELSKSSDESNDAKLAMTEYAGKILATPEVTNGDVALNQAINECKLEVQSLVNETQIHLPTSTRSEQASPNLSKINQRFNAFKTEYYNYLYYQAKSDVIIHTLAGSQVHPVSWTKKIGKWVSGIVCLSLSILVVFLEITPSRFGHGKLFEGKSWMNFLLEISLLVYVTLVSLYAMSCFKFANLHLIPNGQSSPQNALYYSLYSSRLLLPLCFNFITLMPHGNGTQECSFEKVLYRDLKLIPLVDILNRYLPVVFIIVVPLGYFFDLKNKVLVRVLGKEYCYELFGILTDPASPRTGLAPATQETSQAISRSRLDEDYEYSLQDGRYLFQRATNNHHMVDNNTVSGQQAYV
ncbi:LANO_0A01354g1_1 [Lachancea nothofagi CBS 11611]|uniref:LANO_0A01354g1_1 n=1 Tax=Lachancea nothofagi CBS 11611 TaxID=1266666 RepID=A0A1G4IN26_9SACH|nr:LANO_0A01354g1_1 [Lachancea nothofagi CBS 11611]